MRYWGRARPRVCEMKHEVAGIARALVQNHNTEYRWRGLAGFDPYIWYILVSVPCLDPWHSIYSQLRVLGWREEKNVAVVSRVDSTPQDSRTSRNSQYPPRSSESIRGFVPRPIHNTHSSLPATPPKYI